MSLYLDKGDKIFRYEVPVDDQFHRIEMQGGAPLFVACRNPAVVEFWAYHAGQPSRQRTFVVVGTGQPMPEDGLRYLGTALAPNGLVWHLMERI